MHYNSEIKGDIKSSNLTRMKKHFVCSLLASCIPQQDKLGSAGIYNTIRVCSVCWQLF